MTALLAALTQGDICFVLTLAILFLACAVPLAMHSTLRRLTLCDWEELPASGESPDADAEQDLPRDYRDSLHQDDLNR